MKKRKVGGIRGLAFTMAAALVAAPASAQTPVRSPADHFEFHVDRWVSLHHFAYHYVREVERHRKLRGRVPLTEGDRLALSADMRAACSPLVHAYQPYIEGDLRADAETRGLAEALVDGLHAVTDDAVRDALTACMPAYEEALWPRHRAASEKLLRRLMEQLRQHEEAMARRFADTVEGSWPDSPIRVDITAYANWAGAYTDDSPAHITLSSYDEEIAGPYAFELLFHEAGHTVSFERSIRAAANAALDATGLQSNRFWHFVLFFVAGKVTAQVLGDPDYVPYSAAVGLTKRESSADYYDALDETWGSGSSLRERVLRAAQRVAASQ